MYTFPFAQVPTMYAIIQAGGRQMRGSPGGFATIDGTAGEPGATLTIETVLFGEKDGGEVLAGAPFVAKARVMAVVEGETRGPKIRVFKKKRRKGMRRTKGHRATTTRVPLTQPPRLQLAAARRESPRRQRRDRRHDHHPPARTSLPPGAERGHRQGRHDLREDRRPREIRGSRPARARHQHSAGGVISNRVIG